MKRSTKEQALPYLSTSPSKTINRGTQKNYFQNCWCDLVVIGACIIKIVLVVNPCKSDVFFFFFFLNKNNFIENHNNGSFPNKVGRESC